MAETRTFTSENHSATSSEETTAARVRADLEDQRKQADQRLRPALEAHRKQVEQEAVNTLDSEAIAAIQQTERAVNAITENRIEEALAAIEQATGKINILLSRNPSATLIPVNTQVTVIDTAPRTVEDTAVLRDAADVAMDINDLPSARVLLDALRSEIRVRTYHLPLATYPAALQEAARLLDQKKTREAGDVLLIALNTLAAIDQIMPIPLLLAREAVNEAQRQAEKDKDAAQNLLDVAKHELERVVALGYTQEAADYKALREEVEHVRKQLKGNQDTTSLFTRLKEKLGSLTRRQGEKQVRSDGQKQPQKAA